MYILSGTVAVGEEWNPVRLSIFYLWSFVLR